MFIEILIGSLVIILSGAGLNICIGDDPIELNHNPPNRIVGPIEIIVV